MGEFAEVGPLLEKIKAQKEALMAEKGKIIAAYVDAVSKDGWAGGQKYLKTLDPDDRKYILSVAQLSQMTLPHGQRLRLLTDRALQSKEKPIDLELVRKIRKQRAEARRIDREQGGHYLRERTGACEPFILKRPRP